MKNGIIISDTGPIFSLALIDKLDLLIELFEEVYIPKAIWEELTVYHIIDKQRVDILTVHHSSRPLRK